MCNYYGLARRPIHTSIWKIRLPRREPPRRTRFEAPRFETPRISREGEDPIKVANDYAGPPGNLFLDELARNDAHS